MRVYLDVSCLNRPFDDQTQSRIQQETAAIEAVLEKGIRGEWQMVSSSVAIDEIGAMPNPDRRARVHKLLPARSDIMELTEIEYDRAAEIVDFGIKPADALHIAAAETLRANVLLSCDDRLCRAAGRLKGKLRVSVMNPVAWLQGLKHAETEDASHE